MLIWVIFVNLINDADIWYSVIHISLAFWWITSYHFFYNYLSRNQHAINVILAMFLVMFLFNVWVNFFVRENITNTLGKEYVVTGYAYLIILFIPYIILFKQKWLKFLLFTMATLMTISSFKRGAILLLPLMFLWYYYSIARLNGKWASFFTKLIIFSFLLIIALIWINNISGGFLSHRFSTQELEYGSGRSTIWARALNNISNRSTPDLILGTGSGSSIKYLKTGAHNEWIEFLFSFGIIGVLLYANICFALIRKAWKLLKEKSSIAPAYGMMVTFILFVSLYSGMYFAHSSFYIFSFFGLIEYLRLNKT